MHEGRPTDLLGIHVLLKPTYPQVSWPSCASHTTLRLQPGSPNLRVAARRDRRGHRTSLRRIRRPS